jgi:hypothetical protein
MKDDLQGFPNKEISKSEIPDIVYSTGSFENTDKETMKTACNTISVKWDSCT